MFHSGRAENHRIACDHGLESASEFAAKFEPRASRHGGQTCKCMTLPVWKCASETLRA
jgi:hypothetical protein